MTSNDTVPSSISGTGCILRSVLLRSFSDFALSPVIFSYSSPIWQCLAHLVQNERIDQVTDQSSSPKEDTKRVHEVLMSLSPEVPRPSIIHTHTRQRSDRYRSPVTKTHHVFSQLNLANSPNTPTHPIRMLSNQQLFQTSPTHISLTERCTPETQFRRPEIPLINFPSHLPTPLSIHHFANAQWPTALLFTKDECSHLCLPYFRAP